MTAARGKKGSTDVLSRQWCLLRHIPRAPARMAAGELCRRLAAEGFEVTERTVQRDLQTLSRSFPIASDERAKPFGWSWARGAPALSLPGLTPAEALAFRLVRQFIEPLLPASVVRGLAEHFAMADKTLRAATGVARTWPAKVRIVHPTQLLRTPVISEKVYADVTEALLRGRQLKASYGKGEKAKEYDLHPLALVQRGPVTYLVARAYAYEDARLYVLHRFRATEVLDRQANSAFDVDAYLESGGLGFGKGDRIRLEALFERSAADYLRESPLSEDQAFADAPDGKVRMTATVRDTKQLRWWLLGFGAGVEVLKPVALRDAFRDIAAKQERAYAR